MQVQKKLPILIITISLLPLLVLGVVSYCLLTTLSTNIYQTYIDNLTTAVSLQIEDFYDTQINELIFSKEIKAYQAVLNDGTTDNNYEEASLMLNATVETNGYLNENFLVDRNGYIICSSDAQLEGIYFGQSESLVDWQHQNEFAWKYSVDQNGNTEMLMVVDFEGSKNEYLGSIVQQFNLDYLHSSVHNYKIGNTGYLYVMDNQGKVLSHYYETRTGEIPLPNNDALKEFVNEIKTNQLSKPTGFISYDNGFEEVLANYQIVNQTGLIIVAAIPYEEIYKSALQISFIIVLIALVVGGISLFAGLKAAKQIIDPLVDLSKKINLLANGDLTQRWYYQGKDEFKQLSDDVNIMAERLEISTKNLHYGATTDVLTNLPNRKSIYDYMEKFYCRQSKQAAIMMDLNGFKKINDTLGHDAGDLVLKQVAKILMKYQDDNILFARLGGDEFLGFIRNYEEKETIRDLVRNVYDEVAFINKIDDYEFEISTSIGLAFNDFEKSHSELMKTADEMMYQAKKLNHKVKYKEYDPLNLSLFQKD